MEETVWSIDSRRSFSTDLPYWWHALKRYSGSKSQESIFFSLEERNSLGHVDLTGLRTTDLEQSK